MKKVLAVFFLLINVIMYGTEELKVKYPSNLVDIHFFKNLETGSYEGVYTDIFEEFSKKEKKTYNFVYSLKEKQPDIIIRETQEKDKENYMYFSTPFTYRVAVLVLDNSQYKRVSDLRGRDIGYITKQKGIDDIKDRYTNLKINEKEYRNEIDAISALKNGEVDAIVIKNWNESSPIENNFKILDNVLSREKIGVIKTKPELYESLKAFIENQSLETIFKITKKNRVEFYKYLLKNIPDFDYVKERYSEIKLSLMKDEYFIPIYYKEKNRYEGVLFEIIEELEKILEIPFRVVEKGEAYDVLGTYIRDDRDNIVNTKAYYIAQIVVANEKNGIYISEISDLDEAKIIVVNGQKIASYLKGVVKNPTFVEVSTIEEGIEKLKNREGDFLVSYDRPLRGAIINTFAEKEIKIAGSLNDIYGISLGIPKAKKELGGIISAIMSSYTLDETKFYTNNKNNVYIKTNYKLIFQITVPMLIIIVILSVMLRVNIKNKKRLQKLTYVLLETLEKLNQLKETESGAHAKRLSLYVEEICRELNIKGKKAADMMKFAFLHDIGKVIIPTEILNKSEKLTADEFEKMKEHSNYGYEIIKNLNLGKTAENMVRFHHERWNGTGYPLGLKGEEIPLEARIIGLADAYDSMRETKPYKKGMTHEEVVAIIEKENGKSFDKNLVKIFLDNKEKFKEIFENNNSYVDLVSEYQKLMQND